MALIAKYLADKSAWGWGGAVRYKWQQLISDGEVATCSVVDLEVLYSSRSSADWSSNKKSRLNLERAEIDQTTFDRAVEVQGLLTKKTELGHRSVGIPDLIVAACAEQAGLVVLHYDSDFDRIAAVTEQPTEWLGKKGTLKR